MSKTAREIIAEEIERDRVAALFKRLAADLEGARQSLEQLTYAATRAADACRAMIAAAQEPKP